MAIVLKPNSSLFTPKDLFSGDIIDVAGSLNKLGKIAYIKTVNNCDLKIKLNVLEVSFPESKLRMPSLYDKNQPVITKNKNSKFIDTTIETILKGEIETLEVFWSRGDWEITII